MDTLRTMVESFESIELLLNEKSDLLEARVNMLYEALQESERQRTLLEEKVALLQDKLDKNEDLLEMMDEGLLDSENTVTMLQEKLAETTAIAEEAITIATKTTKKLEKEKKRRKLQEQEQPVQEVQEQEQEVQEETPTVRKVLTVYENFLTRRTSFLSFWDMYLLRNHANHIGIETSCKERVQLFADVRSAIDNNEPLENPLVLLGHYEKRLKQTKCYYVDKECLKVHCQYYSLDTTGKNTDDLRSMLFQRL